MALNQWFKFYGGEFLSDPKIASLSAQERSCWITLLSLASISSTPGTVEYLTVEVLLTKSGIDFDPYNPEEWNAALAVLDKFVRMKMITKSEEGVIEINNWVKRQETALTNAERQAKYRKSNEKVTEPVTNVTLDKIREDKNTSELEDEIRVVEVSSFEGEEKAARKPAKYPHSKEVFALFPMPQKSWALNKTQLAHSELLHERGVTSIKGILMFCMQNAKEDFLPSWENPYDLERNWNKIVKFANRNGL